MRTLDAAAVNGLHRAVESVLTQASVLPLELLLVDDGSQPALKSIPEVRALLKMEEIRYIRLSRNRGLVFALNVGLRCARYDLIARIDADDYWRPGKLQKQLAEYSRDPSLTMLGTAMRTIHSDPSEDRDLIRGSSWNEVIDFFAREGCPLPHGSILARKDVFMLLGGYPHDASLRVCEDYALWGTWIRFFRTSMLPDVLFEYSISLTQESNRHISQQQRASLLVQKRFRDLSTYMHIPEAMSALAAILGKSLLETGKLLFIVWRYYSAVIVEREAYEPVKTILPDRIVQVTHEAPGLVLDRVCYLGRKSALCQSYVAHFAHVHDLNVLEAAI